MLWQFLNKHGRKVYATSRATNHRFRPRLELLETRLLPATLFVWTGIDFNTNPSWSDRNNWTTTAGVPANPPTAADDIIFDNRYGNANTTDSVVDAAFQGTVHNVTIDSTYNHKLTLNRKLQVIGTAQVDSGTILSSSGIMEIGDTTTTPASTFNFTAGTISGPGGQPAGGVQIDAKATGNISGTAAKTLNKFGGIEVFGFLNWTGGGPIQLPDTGWIYIVSGGVANFNVAADSSITGGDASAALIPIDVGAGGKLNCTAGTVQAPKTITFAAYMRNLDTVTVSAGKLKCTNGSRNQGTYSISGGAQLVLSGTNVHNLATSTASGSGTLVFDDGSHVTVLASVTAAVGNVEDSASFVDGSGDMQVWGTYNWRKGSWAGGGKTTIGSSTVPATLNLNGTDATGYSLDRNLHNYGTVTWSKAADITVSSSGSISNWAFAMFDIQVDNNINLAAGTNGFSNVGTLQKSAGVGTSEMKVQYLDLGGQIAAKTGTLKFAQIVRITLGGVLIYPPATLNAAAGLQLGGGSVTDNGTLVVTSGWLQSGGTASVATTDETVLATMTSDTVAQTAGTLTLSSGSITTSSTYQQSGGSATLDFSSVIAGDVMTLSGGTFDLDQEGYVQALSGLDVAAGGTLISWESGTIRGNVTNEGTIQLYNTNNYEGSLLIKDNYTQSSSGSLNIILNGPPLSSVLDVNGMAYLAGTLNVNVNYSPASSGDTFKIMAYSDHSGMFSAVAGWALDDSSDPNSLYLTKS